MLEVIINEILNGFKNKIKLILMNFIIFLLQKMMN